MISLLAAIAVAQSLDSGFRNPPSSAYPHTWWHWMAGNVTKQGIKLDLEAMKEAKIGGAHIFDVGQGVPTGPVKYNSDEWRDLMTYAISEGKRLGLDMTMHNCSGWSSSGGPWVQPEDAMKKVVWTQTDITDPVANVDLAEPAKVGGFYRDIAIQAFPTTSAPPPKENNDRTNLTGLGPNPGPIYELNWPKVSRSKVIDIPLSAMAADGTLNYKLPEGKWTIVRIGYTLTGAHNVASRPTGDGLEVDKLSAKSLDRFLAGGLDPLFKRIGDMKNSSLSTVLVDSYETGYNNWTPELLNEFRKRRGYDAKTYLPAIVGYTIDTDERTVKFLFDWRRTIAELWAANYSGHFASKLKERGLQLAIEPYGNGNFDPFTYAKPAGLIMGEYWVGEGVINGSVKHASSVAHVYDHSVVGAEGLTASPGQAGWRNQPRQWKPYADRGYALGINRIIYHRFAHQPWGPEVTPGMTMGPWGSHVDRNVTFWSYMSDWNTYLARCQFMLQSGKFVGDVLLFPGEDSPQSYAGEGAKLPEIPSGYDFDYCGLDPLLTLSVRNGKLALPNGATYSILVLPDSVRMTIPLARKIRSLVADGATVLGPRPVMSPSLAESSGDVMKLGNEVWGMTKSLRGSRAYKNGHVYWGMTVKEVLDRLAVAPDFSANGKGIRSIHRRIGSSESYFVASDQPYPRVATCEFRVKGLAPELWDPETGAVQAAPVWRATQTGTSVEVPLKADGSVFVVFRKKGSPRHFSSVKASPSGPGARPIPMLQIVRAEYGQIGTPGKFKDVTEILRKAADKYSLRISASNSDLGGDPAYMVVKELRVTYMLGGKEQTVTLKENEVLSLGDIGDAGSPPAYEAMNGNLRVWQNGAYRVTSAGGRARTVTVSDLKAARVNGPWTVRFPSGWDAPANLTMKELYSWTESTVFGMKYFSGTANYSKQLRIPTSMFGKGRRVFLDLGDVRELARVRLNGKLVATLWKAPFLVDITDYAKPGSNDLRIEVTNLWVNRLIGDEQFPDDMGWNGDHLRGWPEWFTKGQPRPEPRRKTFTTWRHNYSATPLMPSGLLGPVTIRPARILSR